MNDILKQINEKKMSENKICTHLLTLQDVGSILKIPIKTLRNWVYQKKLPNVKINGHLRFRPTDIESFIKKSIRCNSESQS